MSTNKNQKGFAHFLVLVIVLAVVLAGGWFYSSNKLPTSPPNSMFDEIETTDGLDSNETVTNRCLLTPEIGQCKAAMIRYYFDTEENICKEFVWGGCNGMVPFDTLDECKNTCEQNNEAFDPANWKLYTNQKYGFSFSYPENIYQIDDRTDQQALPKIYLTLDPTESTPRGITILENTSMDHQVKEMKEALSHNDNLIKESKLKVGGVDGELLHYRQPLLESETTVVFVEYNKYVYRFDWIEDQILSTFEFVD